MNTAFDYNGHTVAPSKPVKQLRTVKKTFLVDSADRDTTKFFTNGDFVVSLPRVYENVVSLRLMAAEFPTRALSREHLYTSGPNANAASSKWSNDVPLSPTNFSFLVELEGMNKTDECSVGADKSAYPDSYFAKIPILETSAGFIEYNDHSGQENTARYTPAIGKLDRLRIRTRTHSQQGNRGFIYWTTDGQVARQGNQKSAEFSLSFEIEYLDNVFDDFSQFESRISTRA